VSLDLVRSVRRLTFGPSPSCLKRVQGIGLEAFIEEQLSPDSIDDRNLDRFLSRFAPLSFATPDLFLLREREASLLLRKATLLRALRSERQLLERMVEFWRDHFTVWAGKGAVAILAVAFDRDVLRKHAMGRFQDLLRASLEAPAMLSYLDGRYNSAGSPNENHARELLELHTLGAGSGYSQMDVHEVARALTGFSLSSRWRTHGNATLVRERHDAGIKSPLGFLVERSGTEGLDRLAELLSSHPATARHIARKLCCRFAHTEEPEFLSRVEGAFVRSGGDIRATLSAVLHSPEFLTAPPRLLRPFRWATGLLRSLELPVDGGEAFQEELRSLGEVPFEWPTPNGYPDSEEAWTPRISARFRFAARLAGGQMPGIPWPSDLSTTTVSERLLYRPLSGAEKAALPRRSGEAAVAALLCHPEGLVA
jgi:uncharacterized protein (DUF1800 family)